MVAPVFAHDGEQPADEPVLLPAVRTTPQASQAVIVSTPPTPPTRWLHLAGAALTYAARRLTPIVVEAVLDAVAHRLDQRTSSTPRSSLVSTAPSSSLRSGAGRRRRWRGGHARG